MDFQYWTSGLLLGSALPTAVITEYWCCDKLADKIYYKKINTIPCSIRLWNNIWNVCKSLIMTPCRVETFCFDPHFVSTHFLAIPQYQTPHFISYPTIICNSIFYWFRIIESIPIFFSDRSPIGWFSKWRPNTPCGFKMELRSYSLWFVLS